MVLCSSSGEACRTAAPAEPRSEDADAAFSLFQEAAVLGGSLQTYFIFGDVARL